MMNMKKVIAVLVAGALAISGIAAYADTTASGSTAGEKVTITKQNRGNPLETQLNALVEKGYLDSATRDTVLAAAKNFTPEAKTPGTADRKGTQPTGEQPKGNPMLTALKDKGLITEDIYNTVTAALEKQHAAQRAEDLAPLVSSGAFADAAAAEKAMAALEKLIHEKMDAARPAQTDAAASDSTTKSKPAEMTQAQREEMRTKMDVERTQAQTDALAALTASGDITGAQADAIKAFQAQKESDRKAAMEKEQAARETQMAELATKAGFADAAALKKAMDTFHEKMKVQMDANKDSNGAPTTKPTEEQMTAAKAARDQAAADILSAMVTSGDITSAQADALKTQMAGNDGIGFGGPGHGGHGHGGPEGGPEALAQ